MKKIDITNDFPAGVLAQREAGLYSITPRMPLGNISAEQLAIINGVVQDFGLPGVRVTAGQRLKLQSIPEDKVLAILDRLGPVGEFCKYYVQACPGSAACRMGMQDSMALGARLEEWLNTVDLPCKLKVGVSGCSMCCAESFVRDIGLVGKKNGWTVVFGGNAGKRVRKGDVLAENVSGDGAMAVIEAALGLYGREGKKGERTARFVERVGIERVKAVVPGR